MSAICPIHVKEDDGYQPCAIPSGGGSAAKSRSVGTGTHRLPTTPSQGTIDDDCALMLTDYNDRSVSSLKPRAGSDMCRRVAFKINKATDPAGRLKAIREAL